LETNSFTLIEILLSLIIVAVIISGFSHFINKDLNFSLYQDFQKAQNEFIKTGVVASTYKDFILKDQ
jgi:Tfp pilus assembly protein PilV